MQSSNPGERIATDAVSPDGFTRYFATGIFERIPQVLGINSLSPFTWMTLFDRGRPEGAQFSKRARAAGS